MSHYQQIAVRVILSLWIAIIAGCGNEEEPIACFLAGTEIATPSGKVPIERLRAGDVLWSIFPANGQTVNANVSVVELSHADKYYNIRTEGGRTLRVTGRHPVWLPGRQRFLPAMELAEGDELAIWKQEGTTSARVIAIDAVNETVAVYRVEVDQEPHTFVANEFIVHNKPPPLCVLIRLVSVPSRGGEIYATGIAGDGLFGQGGDTLYCGAAGYESKFSAVPDTNWTFSRWEGTVMSMDSTVAVVVTDSTWIRCVFDTLN